jgi:hypothetical protein
MADDLSILKGKTYAEALDKLDELIKVSSPIFLIGAGCSKCAGLPLTAELTGKVLASATIEDKTKEILGYLKSSFDGTSDANIEDYLSELIDLIAIADRRAERNATVKSVSLGAGTYDGDELRKAADDIKQAIASEVSVSVSVETHRAFIKAIHRPTRPGKALSGQPVDYLVMNYDTLIEDGLALERVSFADGMNGGVTGWWDVQSFKRVELGARVLKLHGSINWCELDGDVLPRRLADRIDVGGTTRKVLIWPASTKYRETQMDPYAQLAEQARMILRPPSGSQRLLVVSGYRFMDTHINVEIERALKESQGRLTVLIFYPEDVIKDPVQKWLDDPSVQEQVIVLGKKCCHHGKQRHDTTDELPWWKFENVTRILAGER